MNRTVAQNSNSELRSNAYMLALPTGWSTRRMRGFPASERRRRAVEAVRVIMRMHGKPFLFFVCPDVASISVSGQEIMTRTVTP